MELKNEVTTPSLSPIGETHDVTADSWFKRNRTILPLLMALTLSSLMCVVLVIFRGYYAAETRYYDLSWNLFLAWIPLFLALGMWWAARKKPGPDLLSAAIFFAWLIFFPNAPYIITDLLGLRERVPVPLWYDLMMIFSFAWTGLIVGFTSLRLVQNLLKSWYGAKVGWIMVIATLAASGFGIYLGRFLRWNSWDVLFAPHQLVVDVIQPLVNPLAHPRTLAVTILYSGFLIVAYLTIVLLSETDLTLEK